MKFSANMFVGGLLLCSAFNSAHVSAEQYAFLVGVRDYSLHGELNSLRYTESDVRTLAKTLYEQSVPAENIVLMTQQIAAKSPRRSPRRDQILKELDLLLSELGPDDSLIVGFSGHGLQFEGESDNYFCPLDAKPSDKSTLISLSDVYQQLEACPARSKILLVDACRDDPLSANAKSAKRIELHSVFDRKPPVITGGTVAIFSCSPSQQSFESRELGSGVFFHFVNRALAGEADSDDDNIVDLPELQFFTVKSVQKWARVNLSRKQIPEVLGRVRGAMSIIELSVSLPETITNSLGAKLNLIPAGEFMMGSPVTEENRSDDEKQHLVRISKAFYMGQTEVTQGQWKSLMGTEPWKGESYVRAGSGFPATYISWNDASEFCTRLSQRDRRTYRLPTEAEWEYACRAGSKSAYGFGDTPSRLSDYGWFDNNADDVGEDYAHAVGLKLPNGFGLFDMHGNVCEWCSDWFAEDYYAESPTVDPAGPGVGSSRVYRGGSWDDDSRYCRSAFRYRVSPGSRGSFLGFRLVSVIESGGSRERRPVESVAEPRPEVP